MSAVSQRYWYGGHPPGAQAATSDRSVRSGQHVLGGLSSWYRDLVSLPRHFGPSVGFRRRWARKSTPGGSEEESEVGVFCKSVLKTFSWAPVSTAAVSMPRFPS